MNLFFWANHVLFCTCLAHIITSKHIDVCDKTWKGPGVWIVFQSAIFKTTMSKIHNSWGSCFWISSASVASKEEISSAQIFSLALEKKSHSLIKTQKPIDLRCRRRRKRSNALKRLSITGGSLKANEIYRNYFNFESEQQQEPMVQRIGSRKT